VANPRNGVDIPFRQVTIDSISPGESWAPSKPFKVRGRKPGLTSVFFIVSQDGRVLAKDYCLVEVAYDDDFPRFR
jgi:hypothetical protein